MPTVRSTEASFAGSGEKQQQPPPRSPTESNDLPDDDLPTCGRNTIPNTRNMSTHQCAFLSAYQKAEYHLDQMEELASQPPLSEPSSATFAEAVTRITRAGETRCPDILHAFAQMENARIAIRADPLANMLLAAGPLQPSERKQLSELLLSPPVPLWMKEIVDAAQTPKTKEALLDVLSWDDNLDHLRNTLTTLARFDNSELRQYNHLYAHFCADTINTRSRLANAKARFDGSPAAATEPEVTSTLEEWLEQKLA